MYRSTAAVIPTSFEGDCQNSHGEMIIESLQLTSPVATSHKMIERGTPTMYRTVRVNVNKRNMLPAAPQANEVALSAMHLSEI